MSDDPKVQRLEQDVKFLGNRVRELSERVASLEMISHPPTNLEPAIKEIVAAEVAKQTQPFSPYGTQPK